MLIPEQKVDFEHRQGKTFRRNLYLTDTDGNIIDLSDCTAKMHIRPSVDGDLTLELSTENGRIAIVGPFGQVSLYIEDDDTADMLPGTYVYDLEIYDSAGETSSPAFGKFKVKAEVTR